MKVILRDKSGVRVDFLRCVNCGMLIGTKPGEPTLVHNCRGETFQRSDLELLLLEVDK